MAQKGQTIFSKLTPVGIYNPDYGIEVAFDLVTSKIIGSTNVVKGLQITVIDGQETFDGAYIDYDEISSFLNNLKTLWNYTSNLEDQETGIIETRTKSGFGISLIELPKEMSEEIELKRFCFLYTGEAYLELDKLANLEELDDIDGIAIFQLEGIKDIIAILEKSLE